MPFNINQIDNIESLSEDSHEELEKYIDSLLEQFCDSPEGKEYQEKEPDVGFWSAEFVYFGFNYIGVTPPCMAVSDVKEIVTNLFPRKVIANSPEQADNAIPELLAFWHFLKRKFELENSDRILKYLSKMESEFKNIMCDSSRFGPSKSFMMTGKEAGFDMTDQSDIDKFTKLYNAGIASQSLKGPPEHLESSAKQKTKKDNNKKKLRKMANSSRKKNRKRK